VKAGFVFVCSPFGGREGDKKKNTTGDVGYPSIHSGVFFATLPYRSARVVFVYDKDRFFSGSILVSVNLVVFLCPGCAAGGMGASPHTR